MHSLRIARIGLLLAISSVSLRADEVIHIQRGATWRYFRGLSEASSPDTGAWRGLGFSDASWAAGAAPFGYGDPPFGTDLSTLAPPMQDNYTTLFLRRTFTVASRSSVVTLEADVDYDDGYVLWINGQELVRQNVPAGNVNFNGLASGNHESGVYETFELPDPSAYIVDGANVVAVQVFNQAITSSDLKFDLELVDPVGIDTIPPAVSSLVPAAGTTVRTLARIDVTFSEAVTGVGASDLLVAEQPASFVSGAGSGPYVFTFPSQPDGSVSVRWAAGHGIADLAAPSNSFGGGAWSYTVDSTLQPPTLVLNEILAANAGGLADEDGERRDWVEIYNSGAAAVALGGMSLTDDAADPGKWTFPARSLGPGQYLVVFCSGKDRRPASGNLHTSFQLSAESEYLGLYGAGAPRQLLFAYAPAFPVQRADISYGLNGPGQLAYFQTPTPGAANSSGSVLAGVVEAPEASLPRGFYVNPFLLSLSSGTPGAAVYYTLDGSEPATTNGVLFNAPFRIEGMARKAVVMVRAAAFKSGFLPSKVSTWTYVFADHVVTQPSDPAGFPATWGNTSTRAGDYEIDPAVINAPGNRTRAIEGLVGIPTLSIVTDADNLWDRTSGIYMNPAQEGLSWERPVSLEFIYPDGGESLQVDCGLRVQGGSSTSDWKSAKVSLRTLFKGDYGAAKLRARVFPDSPVESFDTLVLDAHLNLTYLHPNHDQRVRSQYCRDEYVSDLQLATGNPAPHSLFVNLYLNGLHWGLYNLHERPSGDFQAEYLGGDKLEYDTLRHTGTTVVEGNLSAWNSMMGVARSGLGSNATYLQLQDWLDVPGLVDYMLVNIYAGNDDWPHHNWYAGRRRAPDGRFRFYSWDAEHVLKSATINQTGVSNANTPAELYNLLRQNNAEFRLLFADRVQRHFFDDGVFYVDPQNPAWSEANPERNRPAALYVRRIREIDNAIVLESARWGDNRREPPYTREGEWTAELNGLLTYFTARSTNVLNQLRSASLYPNVGAPVLSRHGGSVDPGFQLSISRPAGTTGTIHFTTDGEDPRTFGSGQPSPSAQTYSSPLVIPSNLRVKARILSGTTWSALTEALFTTPVLYEALEATELMYHSAAGSVYEFIEIKNTGGAVVPLGGAHFAEGLDYAFDEDAALGPGEFLVLAADAAAFAALYPGVEVGGVYAGSLDSSGERLRLADAAGDTVLSLRYDDEGFWPLAADGFGFSLVRAAPGGDPSSPSSWRASAEFLGSPGADDPAPAYGSVVINEVLARSSFPLEDAIELNNTGATAVDVSGWFLSDDRGSLGGLRKFRIPDGTVLAPGGYAVFYEYQFNDGSPTAFALDPCGGEVHLVSADRLTGDLGGYTSSLRFDAAEEGVSTGRVATSAGPDAAVLSARSFGADDPASVAEFRSGRGAPNAPPLFGPVVMNEVHYHPSGSGIEFVELANLADTPVALFDAAAQRGWQISGLRNALDTAPFEFPAGAEVPAFGYALVVPVDPAFFRSRRTVPAAVPVFGPSGGALENGGEDLRLYMPLSPPACSAPFALADRVEYSDAAPWPSAADGGGPALERREAAEYGNEPLNWAASTLPGGTPGAPNSVGPPPPNRPPLPSFTVSPGSGEAPLAVTCNASASSDPDGTITSYSWDFGDGGSGSGRIAVHTFTRSGSFEVELTVEDNGGLSRSTTRAVTVSEPAENQPPVAEFSATPLSGEAPLDVRVDASASRDPDGTIASYAWDFGDGGSGSGRILTHTFTRAGTFRIQLNVTDDRGATAAATEDVVFSGGPNQRPRASFTVTPDGGGAPLEVRVDASASNDPDGTITSYNWDFGDGGSGSGAVLDHTYEGSGNYLIVLIVIDDRSASATAVHTIVVGSQSGAQVPGDCNQDAVLDISDGICLLGHLFLGRPPFLPCGSGGIKEAGNQALLNANGDAGVDLTDAVFLLTYLFRGGAAPVLGTGCVPVEGCPVVCAP